MKRASVKDVSEIVRIHCRAFKGFFLTSLGIPFLTFYYKRFVQSDETVCIVAFEDDKMIGFSAATKECKGFNSRLIKQNFWGFGMLSLRLLLTNPQALVRLAKNLTKISDSVEDDEDYAELYSIGVDGNYQGQGVGKKLLAMTEKVMKKEKVERLSLTTDCDDNDTAIGFYKSMGYQTLYKFETYPNRRMYRLIKVL